jgi:hypothetical protein
MSPDVKIRQVEASAGDGSSFTERLISKIVDNLQIFVNHIHIRYEDETRPDVRTHSLSHSPPFISCFPCHSNTRSLLPASSLKIVFDIFYS